MVVVGVNTHFVLLCVEGVLAQLHRPELVVGLEVRPPPQTAVDDVGEAFSVRDLQTAIQRPAEKAEGHVCLVHTYTDSSFCICYI